MKIIETSIVPLYSLTPVAWNPRLIKEKRFINLVNSIKDDPDLLARRPVLASLDGNIFGGNQRWRAVDWLVKHENWPAEIPAIIEDISEQLAKERALKDNGSWGEWQEQDLAEMLVYLGEQGSNITLLGFDDDELTELLKLVGFDSESDKEQQESEDDNLIVGEGDIWVLDSKNSVCCGDRDNSIDRDRVLASGEISICGFAPSFYSGTDSLSHNVLIAEKVAEILAKSNGLGIIESKPLHVELIIKSWIEITGLEPVKDNGVMWSSYANQT